MDNEIDSALLDHLCSSTGLSRDTCARVVLDVLAEHGETLEAFVKRRHAELKATTDLRNEQIYARIRSEIPSRRFFVDSLSTRQVRRLIYG